MPLSVQTIDRIDQLVARAQARGRAPSVVAAVARDGVIEHVAGAGELPEPHRDLQYRIGSVTKTFTAALVLGLRDEGRLSLDDPLAAHLPVAGDSPVAALRLCDLLSHAGGLQREPDGDWWERAPGHSLADLIGGLAAEKLAGSTYGRYHYSNLAYGLLGGVVERLAGLSWWEAVTRRLLAPLGMNRTTYQAQEPFARGYVVHPWHGTLREEPRHDAAAMAPAGQLWSTAEDLCRWAAFLAGPTPDQPAAAAIVPQETVAQMAAPVVIADPESWTMGYGLGLQLWRRGERVFIGHTGSMPGYLAVLATHRPSRTGVVGFANSYSLPGLGIGTLGLSIVEAVLDREPEVIPQPWRPPAEPPADIEPLCGRWWWMGLEWEAAWDADRSELVVTLAIAGAEPSRFRRRDGDMWAGVSGENEGEILRVRRDGAGAIIALDIAARLFSRDPWPAE